MTGNELERINEIFASYLASYHRPDISEGKKDHEFVMDLVKLLNIMEGYFVKLRLNLSDSETFLSDELVQRLVRAEACNGTDREADLVYMISRPYFDSIGNTSASRGAVMSGEARRVFDYESYPDSLLSNGNPIGSQAVLRVNPTGVFQSDITYEIHNILPHMIKKIEITAEPTKLTRVYDKDRKISVETELFWSS